MNNVWNIPVRPCFNMKNAFPIPLALTVLFSFILPLEQSIGKEDTRPNIILVMADDQGWGQMGYYGHPVLKTPNLDAMAANGIRFDRFYAGAPVCSPTRAAVLTGRANDRTGVYQHGNALRLQERPIARAMQEAGYATGHFGKWHLGTLTKKVPDSNRGGPMHAEHFAPPWENGFQICFSTEAKVPTWDPMLKPAVKAGDAWDAIEDASTATAYGTHYWNERGEIVRQNLDGDNSRVILDRAIPFIESAAQQDARFFAVIWLHTPHLPVVAGPEYRALYSADLSVRERNYYGCVTAMDEQMGRLRQSLRDCGVAENTLVAFCSDNGPEGNSSAPGSAGPLRGRKRSLYEGGIRVPGLIEWPAKIKQARATQMPAVTSDYLPTILDYLDIDMDERPIDGKSLRDLIEGGTQLREKPIGFQSRKQVAWVGDRFKIYRASDTADWELYDLDADPSEAHDLAAVNPERVARMEAELVAWQASCRRSDAGDDY